MKTLKCAALTAAGLLVLSLPALGQGVIVPIVCDIRPCHPRPIPRPVPVSLPVKSIKLDVRIRDQVATTHLEQIFRNDTPYTLEGTYLFPIPESASITEFAIWENGRKLVGEVRSREEARRIYDEIVRRQRDPGLLEYAGRDLFQASIFPIPPNSDKVLELTYTQVLTATSGTLGYRYPLGTGRPLWQHPAASAGPQKFGTVSGRIEITGRQPLRNIYSPSHNIDVSRQGERTANISFETRDNDNDLQLFFGLSPDEIGINLLTYREPGKDGYFMLIASPRDEVTESELVNKDIVFVLDTSGSMAEEGKMEKARAALLFGIRSLRPGDRFNVINFAGEERMMEASLISADAAGKQRGEHFVNALRPSGGTNINDALIAAARQFQANQRPRMLVFMTDGRPTVGTTDPAKIIANFKAANKVDLRVFPFGFGYDVNTALLDKLGSENSGISDYVQPKEDLEVKVSNFFARVSSPVLSDIELDMGGAETELQYPRNLTDIFRGMQAIVVGRYRNAGDLQNITIALRGRAGGAQRTFRITGQALPLRDESNDFLPRLWATRRAGWLIERVRLNGETKELRDEIIELGTRYGIVTPYTSYLATDGSMAGMSRADMRARPAAKSAPPAVSASSGDLAVKMSVRQNSMMGTTSVSAEGREADEQVIIRNNATSRYVANKNFANEDGVWIDAEYSSQRGLPEVKVVFGSDAHLALAASHRDMARYLALGENVVVVWKGKVYRVVAGP
jgi:Ca-activated chloride channel homolog